MERISYKNLALPEIKKNQLLLPAIITGTKKIFILNNKDIQRSLRKDSQDITGPEIILEVFR
ncbi:MAG TPA: hypothetical protein VFM60_07795 [Salinimicrobium sp.]|nr:hypothetical protein [Salinimicrobium sp.]